MRVTDDEAAVEAVLALDGWNPAPLGPCSARASQRRQVAEALVNCVVSNLIFEREPASLELRDAIIMALDISAKHKDRQEARNKALKWARSWFK